MTREPAVPDLGRYQGPAHSAPYAMSRMGSPYALVDMAAEIEKANTMLATMAGGKLGQIADQIRRLQEDARVLLERAQRDAELHRALCGFEKKPGGEYHLYRRESGDVWFSRLAPHEWATKQTHTFEGSYRLESDMSFVRLDEPEDRPESVEVASIKALLAKR